MFVETQERPAGEPAKVGTLKLSEAIRIGAKLRPQGAGFGCSPATCAVMAAVEAVTGEHNFFSMTCPEPKDIWPFLGTAGPVMREIWSKNDHEGWTREQIADWLESQGF